MKIQMKKMQGQFQNMIAEHEIIELKTIISQKGLVPLERLFDNNDVYMKPLTKNLEESIVDCNLGKKDPELVKLSKTLPQG